MSLTKQQRASLPINRRLHFISVRYKKSGHSLDYSLVVVKILAKALKKEKTDYETKNLDHLGLVAAQFDDLGLVELIDQIVPQDKSIRVKAIHETCSARVCLLKDAKPDYFVWQIEGSTASIIEERELRLRRKSCFILASNQLDEQQLTEEEIKKVSQ